MSSLVVFSIDVRRLALFYEDLLEADLFEESSGDVRLVNEREEVLIHSVAQEFAEDIKVSSPPAPRESSPLKPVFDVASLERALASVEAMGGFVTNGGFSMGGLTRRDVLDPDGNVIQLRCRNV